jgi:integrase
MTRTFSKYRGRAGVREEVTLHSLRAGYITRLAKAGLNAVAIKRLARHKSIETSLRYIEATGESFRAGSEEAFG